MRFLPDFRFCLLLCFAHGMQAQTPVEIRALDASRQTILPGATVVIRALPSGQMCCAGVTDVDGFFCTILNPGIPYEFRIEKQGYSGSADTVKVAHLFISYLAALNDTETSHRLLPEANNSVPLPRLEPESPVEKQKPEPPDVPNCEVNIPSKNGYVILFALLEEELPEASRQRLVPEIRLQCRTGGGSFYYMSETVFPNKKRSLAVWKDQFRTKYPGTRVVRIKNGIPLLNN